MYANTDFHQHITYRVLPQPERVFDNPQTLDRADDVFDSYPTMGNHSVFCFLLGTQFTTAWLLVRHRDRNTVERKTTKAQVLQQFTAFGHRLGGLIGNPLIVATAFVGIAQKWHLASIGTKQDVLHVVTLFLAAIVRLLLSIVMRAGDRSFGAIVIKRGAAVSCSCCSV